MHMRHPFAEGVRPPDTQKRNEAFLSMAPTIPSFTTRWFESSVLCLKDAMATTQVVAECDRGTACTERHW